MFGFDPLLVKEIHLAQIIQSAKRPTVLETNKLPIATFFTTYEKTLFDFVYIVVLNTYYNTKEGAKNGSQIRFFYIPGENNIHVCNKIMITYN